MSTVNEEFPAEDLHPIDIVETMAETNDWDFDRINDDQIAMAVEGQWRTYSITIAWSAFDQTLRIICTYSFEPPEERLPNLLDMLNAVNDKCWAGAFTYWKDQQLMTYRYGLVLANEQTPIADQIDRVIGTAFTACERYLPAFNLVVWGDKSSEQAIEIAIAEAYGRA